MNLVPVIPLPPSPLTEPHFYLGAAQEVTCRKLGIEESLPAWVPHRLISQKLFGSDEMIDRAALAYGNYLWATELSNVNSTFNFDQPPIVINGTSFLGVEQYFQLMKSFGISDHEAAKERMSHADPHEAFEIGRTCAMRPDWEAVKDEVMETACRAKFTQHPGLGELLLATGNHPLVQVKPADSYWGTGRDCKGKNALGIILQRIRDELQRR